MRTLSAVLAVILVSTGCTSQKPNVAESGGCGRTPLQRGGLPDWTSSAAPPGGLRYVLSHEDNLVGILFADPLRVPSPPGGPNNKILWIARASRNGQALSLTLQPESGGEAVSQNEPANSSPGEIYPSIVDVPAAGCWQVAAEWDRHRATLELPYAAGV